MAASFSAWAPAFLQHKADSELEREEALGLARLLQATHPDDVDEAQTSPALCLAQNVLGHLLEALDDAADHLADAEARVEHAESLRASTAHDAAARAAPETAAENAENAGTRHPDARERRRIARRRLCLNSHRDACWTPPGAGARETVRRGRGGARARRVVRQRRARGPTLPLEATAKGAPCAAEEPAAEAPPPPPRAADSPMPPAPRRRRTRSSRRRVALPFVDPNALVDPVQAAAEDLRGEGTSAAAHAAVRAEMSPGAPSPPSARRRCARRWR